MLHESQKAPVKLGGLDFGKEGAASEGENQDLTSQEQRSDALNEERVLDKNSCRANCDEEEDSSPDGRVLLQKRQDVSFGSKTTQRDVLLTIDAKQDEAKETNQEVKIGREKVDSEASGQAGQLQTKHPIIIVKHVGYAEQDRVEEDTSHVSVHHPVIPPPRSTLTRATFSPGDKQIQPPALFRGLRAQREGGVRSEHQTAAQTKSSPLGEKRSVSAEKRDDIKAQVGILDQISQFLSREKRADEKQGASLGDEHLQDEGGGGSDGEREETANVSEPVEPIRNVSSAEAAFDAFKAFFSPKPLKKDPENGDLEAMRKKIRTDKDVLRALFEKSSKKTPEKNETSDSKTDAWSPGDGGERTPGRLHAVWPPLKVEKVGLKYTEAEHQAALLQLKREREEELEKLQEDYELKLSRQKLENKEKIFRLESVLNDLQAKLSQVWTHQPGEQKDEAVFTTDDFLHKSFRTVGIQTDREAFIRISEDEDVPRRACRSPLLQKVAPNKLDMVSIRLSLAGQNDESSSSSSAPETCVHPLPPEDTQPHSEPAGPTKQITPPLPPSLCPAPPPPPLPPPPPVPGAAPPPPPPLAGGLTIDKPPRKPALEPSRPMKPLYWTRIQIQDDNNNSLWNILEEHRIINASEFEDLFAKTITKTKRKPLSEAYEKKAKARKIIKLLDSKRSQAVGILISSLHLEMKDIQQAVVAVDHSVVDLEAIEALYDNRGHPEELEKIRKHYETSKEEDVKLLDKPEQFLYELSQSPAFAGRAWCIIFKSTFVDGITSIKRKLNSVSSVCKVLLESSGVREVMGLVLALGNHMNGGNRVRGQADGFGLEILPKLKDVKSKDNRISLVDYVVSYYLHNVDKSSGTDKSAFPLPDPQDVFLAAQVKFDDLSGDLKQLQQDLSKCEKNVQKVCSDSPEELLQPFKDKMEAFVLSARKEHAEMSYQLTTAQQSFQDLVLYFGLKPKPGEKEVTTSHLFMLWFEFCADFKSRWKRENKNISKQRLKEAQLSVKKITAEKKVETRKINPNSLKQRLRQKETSLS
ncbi:formin isoform X2 [Nothobranchius furzeri]|uniref:Formin-like n=2 Tax=Nothobranchius furzeri TaxID=105023 RepID=A0A9D3C2Q4_NOTFU|nr:formin-like [Nothobranchius furzeri]